LDKNLVDLFMQNLSLLRKNTTKYFPPLDVPALDWVKDLLVLRAFESAELAVAEGDELRDTRNDRRLKLKHSPSDTASFWLSARQESPIITKTTIEVRLPYSTSYLCEAGFSAMNTMKRSRLQTLEEDLKLCLSIIVPRTRDIMRHRQAHVSY
jgi:hypothetical protein